MPIAPGDLEIFRGQHQTTVFSSLW